MHCTSGQSLKPALTEEEVPRFPFSIVKPPSSSRARQRQDVESVSDLPVGAVAVDSSQALPSTSDALDAHAQAALHPAAEARSPSSTLEVVHARPVSQHAKGTFKLGKADPVTSQAQPSASAAADQPRCLHAHTAEPAIPGTTAPEAAATTALLLRQLDPLPSDEQQHRLEKQQSVLVNAAMLDGTGGADCLSNKAEAAPEAAASEPLLKKRKVFSS